MTNHLRAIDIKEYAKALDVAKEFADRAEKAEAAIQRVRELHRTVVDEVFTDFGWDGEVEHCQECGYVPTDDEPCPTLAALEHRQVMNDAEKIEALRERHALEAAIQRVREACANGYPDAQYPDYDGGYQTACEDILRALDGDA